MATTMVESWAVDLATIGPIYPWVGSEGLLVVLGLAFWIGWHIWQAALREPHLRGGAAAPEHAGEDRARHARAAPGLGPPAAGISRPLAGAAAT